MDKNFSNNRYSDDLDANFEEYRASKKSVFWSGVGKFLYTVIKAALSTEHTGIPKTRRWADGSARLTWHADNEKLGL